MSFDLNESDMQRTVIALVYEARSTLPKYTRTPRKRGTKRRTGKNKKLSQRMTDRAAIANGKNRLDVRYSELLHAS